MQNLSIASVIEKNKISSSSALVFSIEAKVIDRFTGNHVETVYLVNHYKNILINGVEHTCVPFSVDLNSEVGEVQNVTLSVQDQAGLVTPYLRQYSGMVGSEVILSLVTVESESSEAARVDFSEVFGVVSSGVDDYVVSFEMGAENPLTRLCPKRTQLRDRCSFRYKSTECGYTGDNASCDLTLTGSNGCRVHDNEPRYGGCPSITVREI